MTIALGAAILVVVVGASVTAMLLVRRRAPEGGYFADGDRASGVFGLLATGFSVIIGFVVFLAFSTYDSARTGAEAEALLVAQQVETAQLFPEDDAAALTAGLVCYARAVAGPQWEQMRDGSLGDQLNPWGPVLFAEFRSIDPATSSEESAYDAFLGQTQAREAARNDRVHLASGIIPAPLWIVLFLISVVIFGFMLCFADRAERRTSQAVLMGSVMGVVVSLLLLLQFLDDPYRPGLGSLEPTAMERALTIIDEELAAVGQDLALPCDAQGVPVD